ncbi:hypothetical protein SODALDRAFT_330912 [Sodiomyces alkalinus F11]|uniref:Uncharacterized protein n=1 Tax=Sodiomyces alkalinus (strain CBS 110278 / VKM F-3762 / F11) TaxID=1314773 RepID=A0A3N2Q397_SODAK|nr:hypothetical protein SODALDRAFT_330912 [Sodiomyces alkalinus F11]ROT41196.1 hypothetical protein SODALDRAFT_330912 [Sodiomyces alkalinus F11]
MSGTNPWLQRQRKSDLVELAEFVGLKGYEGQRKVDLEATLDEFLSENAAHFSTEPKLVPYYVSRAKATGSPTKRELAPREEALKIIKRRVTRAASEVLPADSAQEEASSSQSQSPSPSPSPSRSPSPPSVALETRTPARNLSLAGRLPLPATPAEVAQVVDRSASAVRTRVTSIYQESGITEGAHAVQETLSTVGSIIFTITLFELYSLRPEVLPGRYAFTIPSMPALGTGPMPIYVPDMFLVLSSSFWSPVLTWIATALIIPSVFGYFYNLNSASHAPRRGRPSRPDYDVDPLTFSIVKGLVSFVVLGQKVTVAGYPSVHSIDRINSAIYGGWRGIITGAAVSALVSIYDAVLRK